MSFPVWSRPLTLVVSGVAASGVLLSNGPVVAQAAAPAITPPAGYARVCGAGWALAVAGRTGQVQALVFRKGSRVCALSVNLSGHRRLTGIGLYSNDREVGEDVGQYASYAGPVYATVGRGQYVHAYAFSGTQRALAVLHG